MKKLFGKANLSFMVALQMLVLPAVICLIVSIFMLGREMNSTYSDAEALYYDKLYQINSNLVNADRDFYQAMNAAQQYMSISQSDGSLPEDVMNQLYAARSASFDENLAQTLERISKANEIAQTDSYLYTGISIDGKAPVDVHETCRRVLTVLDILFQPCAPFAMRDLLFRLDEPAPDLHGRAERHLLDGIACLFLDEVDFPRKHGQPVLTDRPARGFCWFVHVCSFRDTITVERR